MITNIITEINDENMGYAAGIIKSGGLVAFPTETVYGLGANALDSDAAVKIYAAKGRPSDNPLIIHLAMPSDAEKYCYTSELFYKLAERFMPGPITVILPKRKCIPYEVTAGLDSVAVRIPSNQIAHNLIELSGVPIAAPSANLSGKPSPTRVQHVIDDMDGRIDVIIDGGECDIGVESTIVKLDGDVTLLRPGGITYEELCEICGNVVVGGSVTDKFTGKPIAPGMKYRHYAPDAPVKLLDGSEEAIRKFLDACDDECGILCYDEDKELLDRKNSISLGSRSDYTTQAHRLFDSLRKFNRVKIIYAHLPEKSGVGLAVFNRLIKAAGFEIIKL